MQYKRIQLRRLGRSRPGPASTDPDFGGSPATGFWNCSRSREADFTREGIADGQPPRPSPSVLGEDSSFTSDRYLAQIRSDLGQVSDRPGVYRVVVFVDSDVLVSVAARTVLGCEIPETCSTR